MTNKKDDLRRLGIYLLIVASSSAMLFACFKLINQSETAFAILSEVFCAAPALANLITRAVTKEGFRDMKLHLHLSGNLRYYLLAFLLPFVCTFMSYIPPIIFGGHSDWLGGFTLKNIVAAILMLAAQGAVMSAGLVGEELGWRGYMNQKMEPLVGVVGTVLIGGAVWSLWHLPSDMSLYLADEETLSEAMKNVGGRLLFLPGYAAFYMWLTKKTDSVWPAVLSHGISNASQTCIMELLRMGDIPENAEINSGILEFVPFIITGIVFLWLMLRDKKKTEQKN